MIPPARAQLDALREADLLRAMRVVDSATGPTVTLDGREVTLLCSNDYLGLAGHPDVRRAAARAAERWGAGSGSSRLVSGNLAIHDRLERELADFKGAEACVLFGAGYLANVGVVSALCAAGEVVLSDALNHASIIDGCRLAGAAVAVYPHADLGALEHLLVSHSDQPVTVVTDAVFSMDGDCAPLAEIVALARRHGARVIVDEAHATGVVGPRGQGLAATLGLAPGPDLVVIGTLSKALGSYGAFACCDADTAALLVNRARPLIFSTGLPPAAVGAALESLSLLRGGTALVERLHVNARLLRELLGVEGDPSMPIVPLVFGEAGTALAASAQALERGVFAQAIRPPTVPEGTSRLRLVATAAHDEDQLRAAAAVLQDACAPA